MARLTAIFAEENATYRTLKEQDDMALKGKSIIKKTGESIYVPKRPKPKTDK